jgi:hypothetical protein
MLENFEIKIVRMKSGEDVIGFIYEDHKNRKTHIKFPKTFYFNYDTDTDEEELILIDWMTPRAYAYQEISICSDNILFTSYSNIEFGQGYLESILNNLNPESELAAKIQQTIDNIIVEELEIPTNSTLH